LFRLKHALPNFILLKRLTSAVAHIVYIHHIMLWHLHNSFFSVETRRTFSFWSKDFRLPLDLLGSRNAFSHCNRFAAEEKGKNALFREDDRRKRENNDNTLFWCQRRWKRRERIKSSALLRFIQRQLRAHDNNNNKIITIT